MKEEILEKILKKIYRIISIRPRTEKEIKDYLEKQLKKNSLEKSLFEEIKEKILQELKNQNLINDEKFIEWWVDQRSYFRPKGMIVLKNELRQKGVDSRLIEKYFENQKINEYQLAEKALEKKIAYFKNLFPKEKRFKKAMNFLLRRGFSYSVCLQVLKKFLN